MSELNIKTCRDCGIQLTKGVNWLPYRSRKRDYQCSPCHSVATLSRYHATKKVSRENIKHPFNEARRSAGYYTKFGITLKDYNEMLEEQGGVCAICGRVCSTGMNLAVDHCHVTGEIRGLLCQGCNVSLARFNDDVAVLKNAIVYLEKERKKK